MQAIRIEDDFAWVVDADNEPPRDVQLMLLLLVGQDMRRSPQPLRKPGTNGQGRPQRRWLEKARAASAPNRDDPAVLPAQVRGQLALFAQKRRLHDAAGRIRLRPLPGRHAAEEEVRGLAAEQGRSGTWRRNVLDMVLLSLAVRDAEGQDRIREESLAQLPIFQDAVKKVAERLGLLLPRPQPEPGPQPRSCLDCGCWMADFHGWRCSGCSNWRRFPDTLGRCDRCGRDAIPLHDRQCRSCKVAIRWDGPEAADRRWTQLWFGEPIPGGMRMLRHQLGYRPESVGRAPRRDRLAAERRAARTRMTGFPVDPDQLILFPARRDWTKLVHASPSELPQLSPVGQRIVNDFQQWARERQWDDRARKTNARALIIVVSWLGGDALIQEADIAQLAALSPNISGKPLCRFLNARSLLAPDPSRHIDRDRVWVENALAEQPAMIAGELRTWVTVCRGEGGWEHPAVSYHLIRRYFRALQPALRNWRAQGITSLKEITRDLAEKQIEARQGSAAVAVHVALRSVFSALKQERILFLNPTKNISLGSKTSLPTPVPSDVLPRVMAMATSAFERLVIALVAIHAVSGQEIRHLRTADLDLADGRLRVERGAWRHTVFLDEFTHRLTDEWLRERHGRWPGSTNPYLLVSQQTALNDEHPPIHTNSLKKVFRSKELTMMQMRQDRILDEASVTADPLHLMRLFGVAETTAMRYIAAAHPERTAKLPR